MEKETLILKRATKSASLRMLMDNIGKDPAGIYKSITFYKIKEAEGTRRKVVFFDWSLRLFSSHWRHLRLKVCVVALDKSQASLIVGNNGVDGNCSVQISVHDKIRIYVCGASIQQLFSLYIWTVRFYS
jgi:hypothetical protein